MKLITIYGLLGKTEATYNAGGVLAEATDGILLAEPVTMPASYIHDGKRGRNPGNSGSRKNVKASGRFTELTPKIEARGAGAAYSATVLPKDLHTLLRISGHSAEIDTTLTAEKVTYRPVTAQADFISGVFDGYARGQKYAITGAYADLAFMIEGPGLMMFEFPMQGLVGLPTDVGVPSIVYPVLDPPKAENVALSISGFAPKVRSVGFKANRTRSGRADINSAGHAGFAPGGRTPELEITIEAEALSTFDPYTAKELATSFAVNFTVGATQYNRIKFAAAQAQIDTVEEEEDEEVATWKLTMSCPTSTPTADDDYELIFD